MSLLSQKQIKTSLSFYCEAVVSLLTDMFVSKFLKVDIALASFFLLFFCQVAPVCSERYIFSDELVPYRLKCCIQLVLILPIVKEPVEAHLGAACSPRGSPVRPLLLWEDNSLGIANFKNRHTQRAQDSLLVHILQNAWADKQMLQRKWNKLPIVGIYCFK